MPRVPSRPQSSWKAEPVAELALLVRSHPVLVVSRQQVALGGGLLEQRREHLEAQVRDAERTQLVRSRREIDLERGVVGEEPFPLRELQASVEGVAQAQPSVACQHPRALAIECQQLGGSGRVQIGEERRQWAFERPTRV